MRRQHGPRAGDIGDDPREYEFEPITDPGVVPETVPQPAPQPEREPVPA